MATSSWTRDFNSLNDRQASSGMVSQVKNLRTLTGRLAFPHTSSNDFYLDVQGQLIHIGGSGWVFPKGFFWREGDTLVVSGPVVYDQMGVIIQIITFSMEFAESG